MTLKIIGNLVSESIPVIRDTKKEEVKYPASYLSSSIEHTVSCKDFKGEISSITGIVSKFMYLGRIDQLTGEPGNPTIRIICGEECKDKCINITKTNNND